jgi:hypothetical protein
VEKKGEKGEERRGWRIKIYMFVIKTIFSRK